VAQLEQPKAEKNDDTCTEISGGALEKGRNNTGKVKNHGGIAGRDSHAKGPKGEKRCLRQNPCRNH